MASLLFNMPTLPHHPHSMAYKFTPIKIKIYTQTAAGGMRSRLCLLALTLCALLWCGGGWAQEPIFRQITADDGLSDNEVYDMLQAKDGAMWFATNLGICRFNGNFFKYYANPTQRSKAATGLHQDDKGRVWAFNFFGEVFYVEGDSLKMFEAFNSAETDNQISMAWSPQNSAFVITTNASIYHYKYIGAGAGNQSGFSLVQRWPIQATDAFFDSKNRCWMLGRQNLKKGALMLQGNQLQAIPLQEGPNVNNPQLQQLLEHNGDVLMVDKVQQQIYRFNGRFFEPFKTLEKVAFVNFIQPANGGEAYLLTRQGVWRVGPQWDVKPAFPAANGHNVSKVLVDKEGNSWISTLDAGVILQPNTPLKTWNDFNALVGSEKVTTVCNGPNSQLLLGFGNGKLALFEPTHGKLTVLFSPKTPGQVSVLKYLPQLNLVCWHSNITYSAWLLPQFSLCRPICYGALKDVDWVSQASAAIVSTGSGLEAANLATLTQPSKSGFKPTVLNLPPFNKRTRAVAWDSASQSVLVGSKEGLGAIRGGSYDSITMLATQLYATAFGKIPGGLLVGTTNRGLILLRRADSGFTAQKTAITDNVLHLAVAYPHAWVHTDRGLKYLNLLSGQVQTLNKSDGLPTSQVNGIAILNNSLFIATPLGLTTYPLQGSTTQGGMPAFPLAIKNISVNGVATPLLGLLTLKHYQNRLRIEAEMPSYKSANGMQFRYKIGAVDSAWRTSKDGIINLDQLQPGRYDVHIAATGYDAIGALAAQHVIINIAPPFWQRWYWYTGIVLLMAGVAVFLMQQRLKRLKKIALEKLEKQRLNASLKRSMLTSIKAQMNPHFIFNALNTIQSFIYSNNKKEANAYLAKFSHLMRMVLEMSNHETVLLEEEIKALKLYLEMERMRFDDTLEFGFEVSAGIKAGHIRIPSMIVQPFVENAIKHGLLHRKTQRELLISFTLQEQGSLLKVTIDDNGIGRAKSAELNRRKNSQFQSFSSMANQKRLELLNMDRKEPIGLTYIDKTDQRGNALGTTVEISIPVRQADQKPHW
ncbi:MAG: hypothetical protein EAY75_15535 [Bacteroidetes bacterium]|nr:MAG: hypothetical protein EAY75_15535 [Bacteroidota bacterium]